MTQWPRRCRLLWSVPDQQLRCVATSGCYATPSTGSVYTRWDAIPSTARLPSFAPNISVASRTWGITIVARQHHGSLSPCASAAMSPVWLVACHHRRWHHIYNCALQQLLSKCPRSSSSSSSSRELSCWLLMWSSSDNTNLTAVNAGVHHSATPAQLTSSLHWELWLLAVWSDTKFAYCVERCHPLVASYLTVADWSLFCCTSLIFCSHQMSATLTAPKSVVSVDGLTMTLFPTALRASSWTCCYHICQTPRWSCAQCQYQILTANMLPVFTMRAMLAWY